uniref:MFS domain-containing protein n=1 Tax=Strongyloides stercoralis TaxID=6248 RepID=A0A0K0E3Y0_STRER
MERKKSSSFWSFKSRRMHVIILLMFGWGIMAFTRHQLGISLPCMLNSTAIEEASSNKSNKNDINLDELENAKECLKINNVKNISYFIDKKIVIDYGGTFNWTYNQQDLVISGTYFGSIITVLPAGYFSDKISPRNIMIYGSIIYIITSISFPKLVIAFGYLPGFITRFIMGLGEGMLLPASSSMLSRWFPNSEKPLASTLLTVGNQMATFIGNPLAAFFCKSSIGWSGTFYTCGIVLFIWIILWYYFVQNSPSTAKWISINEKEYLEKETGFRLIKKEKNKKFKIPWKSFLTSSAFYCTFPCFFFGNMHGVFLSMYLPLYYKEKLYVDVVNNGFMSAVPTIIQMIVKIIWSSCTERLQKKNYITSNTSVKVSQIVSSILLPVGLIMVDSTLDCTNPWITVIYICIANCGYGIATSGYLTSIISMAPAITGLLSGITNIAAITSRILTPFIFSFIRKTKIIDVWSGIFYGIAINWFISSLIFIYWGVGEAQEWGIIKDTTETESITETNESLKSKTTSISSNK